ncbi:hypothetical protein BWQ96_06597 [Gracilariopsis chorda]|uniref:Uncharacterized protein n=1 Tax=Gracilariopsis chorda TaxID=448386 RepID=A0A2V3INH8_9FLOR|nr:hypothetical protein BWQ96_06597 [Gracilariopsis chorda]|eukprot:PXF43638.1 hypothetical protein BWQ96_06597 [Gracilariopsis chorda]
MQSSGKPCRQEQKFYGSLACLVGRGDVDDKAEKNANRRLQGKLLEGQVAQGGDWKIDKREDVEDAAAELARQAAAVPQAENEDKADKVLPFCVSVGGSGRLKGGANANEVNDCMWLGACVC